MIATLSGASFMAGALLGFLFTSYKEEASTVGKIRDWLIAGATGATLSQLIDKETSLKHLLGTFSADPGPNAYALVVGTAIIYSGLGFFCMFFARELIFNIRLAQSRAERGRLEGTTQAGLVTQQLLLTLPVNILYGVADIEDIVQFRKSEAEKLRERLYSPDVQRFLDEATSLVSVGGISDWDVISKVANLHYYRIYFEKGAKKEYQAELALEWIQRALVINPVHVDLTMKYVDTLGILDRPDEAIAVLERIERTPEAPAYARQWLGYYLLDIPSRIDDAIRYSEAYHALFPDESDSLFNVAYGYGEKYCAELCSAGLTEKLDSANRKQALTFLRDALRQQPEFAETVRTKWVEKGKGFECLSNDTEFRALVGPADTKETA